MLRFMDGEPTMKDLQREFPGWHFWVGIAGLKYARKPNSSPPQVVGPGEDWTDLRDQLNGHLGRTAPADVAGAGQGDAPWGNPPRSPQ
jgi:hypothetical protein